MQIQILLYLLYKMNFLDWVSNLIDLPIDKSALCYKEKDNSLKKVEFN